MLRRRFFLENSNRYFTISIIAKTSGSLPTITFSGSTLYYRKNNTQWIKLSSGIPLNVEQNDEIEFKIDPKMVLPGSSIGRFSMYNIASCAIKYNIMSLIFGDDFKNQYNLIGYDYVFLNLFKDCTCITQALELTLPATILGVGCYQQMFYNCSGLLTAPELPVETLASCCYYRMFFNCTTLNYIKMLATDISAADCLNGWVTDVASSGTFVKHSDMTTLPTGISGIPKGWTVVNDGEDGGGNNLITFMVDGVEYQAEEGMTWADWLDSEYNIDRFYTTGIWGEVITFKIDYRAYYVDSVSPEDIIINTNYTVSSGGLELE